MVLSEYPGPKAQLHYVDEIGQPLFFCDTTELFNVVLKPEQQRKVKAIYVQDMAQTDWDEPHGAWIDAKTAFYVVGSSRHGSMGPTIGSFSSKEAAEKFAAEFGGHVHPFSEITEDMSQLDGGALHDQMM
ncbi:Predicted lipoprotein involved in nitrous oxide reduction [gamma proteobacterium HdN1]|nr:Predicted lipoprotein involved in nitrous oxide reduction [gamma proteobacterium HdN1]